MEQISLKFEDYTFYTTDVVVSLGIRFNRSRIARKDRKNMLISFCNQTGIEFPPSSTKKYNLPEKYVISSDEIDLLHKEQESIALVILDRYNTIQARAITKITELKNNIETLNNILDEESKKLFSYKSKYQNSKPHSKRFRLKQISLTKKLKLKISNQISISSLLN